MLKVDFFFKHLQLLHVTQASFLGKVCEFAIIKHSTQRFSLTWCPSASINSTSWALALSDPGWPTPTYSHVASWLVNQPSPVPLSSQNMPFSSRKHGVQRSQELFLWTFACFCQSVNTKLQNMWKCSQNRTSAVAALMPRPSRDGFLRLAPSHNLRRRCWGILTWCGAE